MSGSLHLDSSN